MSYLATRAMESLLPLLFRSIRPRSAGVAFYQAISSTSCPPLPFLSSAAVRARASAKTFTAMSASKLPASRWPARAGPERIAYVALGSNMGDRIQWIEKACNEMDARGIRVNRTSSLWETEPMYVLDQDRFVNGVCEVSTTQEPLALLDELQAIENSLGRRKVIDKGPRNIDLDILLYEDEKIDHPRLKIPHIGIYEREFVLRPLAELIPDRHIDPDRREKTALDHLAALPPSPAPMSTIAPLSPYIPPLHPLSPSRPTHAMAILNLTPDSFSDGGLYPSMPDSQLAATVTALVAAGATILDVGGQSTAPGAPEVTADEELARVLPAIRLIRSLPLSATGGHPVTVSVDTYRAAVAEAAVAAGADVVNDVSAGALDPHMLPTVARLGRTVVLMHMRGTPATMGGLNRYDPGDLVPAIARELAARVAAAEAAGVRRWRIVLDPGLGFAKRGDQNLRVLERLGALRDGRAVGAPQLRGFPWLVGPSRKSFVGSAVLERPGPRRRASGSGSGDLSGPTEQDAGDEAAGGAGGIAAVPGTQDRSYGTAAAVAAAVQGGADIIRVHDVKAMMDVVRFSTRLWTNR